MCLVELFGFGRWLAWCGLGCPERLRFTFVFEFPFDMLPLLLLLLLMLFSVGGVVVGVVVVLC